MKSVLIDASSAILLFKAELFVRMIRLYRITVVPSVMREITVPDRSGSFFFQQMLSKGHLKLSPLLLPVKAEAGLEALDRGERDTLIAFGCSGADFVIIDDRKGAKWCRSKKIPYVNALLCARILFLSGHLSEGTYLLQSKQLLEIGRYSRWVIDFAQCCNADQLTLFMPDQSVQKNHGGETTGRLETHLLNN